MEGGAQGGGDHGSQPGQHPLQQQQQNQQQAQQQAQFANGSQHNTEQPQLTEADVEVDETDNTLRPFPEEGRPSRTSLQGIMYDEFEEDGLNVQTAPEWEQEDMARRLPTQNERVIFQQFSEMRQQAEEELRKAMTTISSDAAIMGSPRFSFDPDDPSF